MGKLRSLPSLTPRLTPPDSNDTNPWLYNHHTSSAPLSLWERVRVRVPTGILQGEAIVQESFAAYVVKKNDDRVEGEVTTLRADQLPAGDVTIAVAYSSLNYKDALAATGQGGIVRNYPHVPGIDAAGTVVESQSAAVAVGDRVLVTGYDLGVGSFGGYAAYVRVPAAWVVKIPATLTTFDAMVLGTAGFTAAMCLLAMERNGTRPEQGPVLVTGATGGVGSVAVDLLAQQGYTVAASTGKTDQHDYLRQLGASQILQPRGGESHR